MSGFGPEELAQIYRTHINDTMEAGGFAKAPTKRELQTTLEDLKDLQSSTRAEDPKEFKKFFNALKSYVKLVEAETGKEEPRARMKFLDKNKPFLEVLATSFNGWRVEDMKELISELEQSRKSAAE